MKTLSKGEEAAIKSLNYILDRIYGPLRKDKGNETYHPTTNEEIERHNVPHLENKDK